MRTNHAGVTEVAHLRTDLNKFGKEMERIYGQKPSPFCEKCELRHSLCECDKKEVKVEEKKEHTFTLDGIEKDQLVLALTHYISCHQVNDPDLAILKPLLMKIEQWKA